MSPNDLNQLEQYAAIFASLATGLSFLIALVFGLFQLRAAAKNREATRRSNQMQALIAFDEMLENYHHVHIALRPGGELFDKVKLSHQERTDIERYMGLFERAKVFIDDQFLTIDHFKNLYGYRMRNLARHPWVRSEKLIERQAGWTYFLALYGLLYKKDYQEIIKAAQLKADNTATE